MSTSKLIGWMTAVGLGLALQACGPSGVGDPCIPQPLPLIEGGISCSGAGCYASSEIYIETRSLQCRTRVCLVYHWEQQTQAEKRAEHVFCSHKCTSQADCPQPDFTCVTAFVAGNPGVRGDYCVRSSLVDAGHD